MPARGLSIHIGLNRVDPKHYGGWDGQLTACEFDAKDMAALCKARGFTPQLLLTPSATAAAVTGALRQAATKLQSGDVLVLSYSGHGGQVPDTNDEEPDGTDETWVLYDRQLVDDELYALWGKFKPGVRIAVFSDSCHSGTVVKAMPIYAGIGGVAGLPVGQRYRAMPDPVRRKTYARNKPLYDGIQKAHAKGDQVAVHASVILISGCQDNQLSLDGDRNGLFTETLKKVWRKGKFAGGYRVFRRAIAQRMPPTQSPNFFRAGKVSKAFELQKPFTV
ncbi:MAG: caspase family protein [Verrucomicrobia bacterium]|nr:caspase family protein [Verrucomicrobiota bacterium]